MFLWIATVVGVVALASSSSITWLVSTRKRRRRALCEQQFQSDVIASRAEQQNEWYLNGDPRGFFGNFPIPTSNPLYHDAVVTASLELPEEPVGKEGELEAIVADFDAFAGEVKQLDKVIEQKVIEQKPNHPTYTMMGLPISFNPDVPKWSEASAPETLSVTEAWTMLANVDAVIGAINSSVVGNTVEVINAIIESLALGRAS